MRIVLATIWSWSLVGILLLMFCRGYEVESWLRFWTRLWILSLVEMLMFGWNFEVDAWSRFWRWNLIKICVWIRDMTSRSYFGKMNSNLGSVVPSQPPCWGCKKTTDQAAVLCRVASPSPACSSTSARVDNSISGPMGPPIACQSCALSHIYLVKYTVQPTPVWGVPCPCNALAMF